MSLKTSVKVSSRVDSHHMSLECCRMSFRFPLYWQESATDFQSETCVALMAAYMFQCKMGRVPHLHNFNFHFRIICRWQWNKKEGHRVWAHWLAEFHQFNQLFLDHKAFCHLLDIWAILFFFHGIWTEWWKPCLSRINCAHTLYQQHTKAHNLSGPTHIYIWAMSVWAIRRFILRRNLSSIQRLTRIYGTSCAI